MIKDKRELREILKALRDDGGNGDMSGDTFKASIAAVGLTQEAAGEFFGKYKRVGQAWATGEKPVPLLIQQCLEFMVENELKAEDLE
jgi:hypothetical protein